MSLIFALMVGLAVAAPARAQSAAPAAPFGLGHTPSADALKSIDIDVLPDGRGLPPGSGTAAAGKAIYAARCASCHGATGTEGPNDVLAGGRGSLASPRPVKTVGSYWPYATTLWDYINRAMPFDHPRSMSVDDTYAVTAYVLFLNSIVSEQQAISQSTLPQIVMPNRNGFVPDTRPDTSPPHDR